jgi:hypothetical protein
MLRDHVQFGGEGVEAADYALEFVSEVGVLFLKSAVVGLVVGVCVAEGGDLHMLVWQNAFNDS